MSAHDQVLSDFIDDWNAGRRPSVREFLARVPEGPGRDALADGLATWLETAPAAPLPAQAREQVRRERVVESVLRVVGDDASQWPQALPRLRERAGLGVRELAEELVARLRLGGAAEARRAAGYLEQMERGERRADRVSRRLLDALGQILGVGGATLADIGGGGGAFPPAAAGGTLFRAADDAAQAAVPDLDALAAAALTPAPAPMDELDRLFDGGPDG